VSGRRHRRRTRRTWRAWRAWRRAGHPAGDDRGTAVVEFLAAAVLLLLPVLYLVLVLGRLQAATFAAEGAAREAGRSFTTAPSVTEARPRATASVRIALDDQGFTDVDAASALAVSCSTTPCLEPGSDVLVRVSFEVPLPAVPSFVQSVVPLSIPVSAEHVAPVDSFLVTP
jgi:Flp pilus assembly protein TadG